ncbi:hypothetical protein MtrunA17_Chr4g0006671 [Medicago truncatula]|uniref:Uncharacterized protein n=2 Tax=Medicago truncatula TaxID=3880 RepID=A0A396HZQ8_MEDTR|nr:hypothetical protein MtrunA17_Chr4g0006671 [Medicago truncatula]
MSFNSLVSLETGRLEWRVKVKVRVTRKWNVESSFFRGKVNTIELILLDIDVFSSDHLCVCVNQNPMRVAIADQLEFNRIYHSKTIFELVKSSETGLSIVCARIVGCFQVDQWWYPLCDCSNCIK